MRRSTAAFASSLLVVAALMCSKVHPLGPPVGQGFHDLAEDLLSDDSRWCVGGWEGGWIFWGVEGWEIM
jgi:hypothetical protein